MDGIFPSRKARSASSHPSRSETKSRGVPPSSDLIVEVFPGLTGLRAFWSACKSDPDHEQLIPSRSDTARASCSHAETFLESG